MCWTFLVSELISKITSCLKFLQKLLTFHWLILILLVLSNKLHAYLFKLYFPQIYAIICDCRISLGSNISDISQANCRSDQLLWRPRSCSWIFTDLFDCLNGTSTIFSTLHRFGHCEIVAQRKAFGFLAMFLATGLALISPRGACCHQKQHGMGKNRRILDENLL